MPGSYTLEPESLIFLASRIASAPAVDGSAPLAASVAGAGRTSEASVSEKVFYLARDKEILHLKMDA